MKMKRRYRGDLSSKIKEKTFKEEKPRTGKISAGGFFALTSLLSLQGRGGNKLSAKWQASFYKEGFLKLRGRI